MEKTLPSIPAKRYFTIGEVSDLCGVKPHVLRYWEQEFSQLRPMKRRGNRRYYQHHEVLMIRRIRDLLYDQGFTISGARNKLQEIVQTERDKRRNGEIMLDGVDALEAGDSVLNDFEDSVDFEDSEHADADLPDGSISQQRLQLVRRELFEIRDLLSPLTQPIY
ncbi:MerR family transcriptional regulator [Polaromonas sp.]|uniref:MerR family transcriptional regulator n=1 Tax=Polaromonas sp. TaxID=1869339 RepID=UPI0018191D3E|nr:MerR family transcriptional regulator [Polaromonas sp.]NMM06908.1 MerR family transcriptional regulator [Polaromonas sp.]